MEEKKRAVVTVLGIDRKGIIAHVSAALYKNEANVLDISQTVVSEYFNMVLVADISAPECDFAALSNDLNALGEEMNLQIRVQRSEIFETLYRV